MAKKYYPIALDLKDKTALVVGGGAVAERKIKSLLKAQVRVEVVSPNLTTALGRLAKRGVIKWLPRKIRRLDIAGKNLVISATSSAAANKQVSTWSKAREILVNVVDQPHLSNFISPAVLHVKKAKVAVYTDGKDPLLSRDLKNFLKEYWDAFLSYRRRL